MLVQYDTCCACISESKVYFTESTDEESCESNSTKESLADSKVEEEPGNGNPPRNLPLLRIPSVRLTVVWWRYTEGGHQESDATRRHRTTDKEVAACAQYVTTDTAYSSGH